MVELKVIFNFVFSNKAQPTGDKDTFLHIYMHRKSCSRKGASNSKPCDHE